MYPRRIVRTDQHVWKPILGAALVAVRMFTAAPALADDAPVLKATQAIVDDDLANSNFGSAKKKLKALLDKCGKKPTCQDSTLADLHIALGMVAVATGKTDEGAAEFREALKLDGARGLPKSATPPMVDAFGEAKIAVAADVKKADPNDPTELANQALVAEAEGKFDVCAEKNRASLVRAESREVRQHLVACLRAQKKYVDALREAQIGLKIAAQAADGVALTNAKATVAELLPLLAHVSFNVPSGIDDLKVSFDGRVIPPDGLAKEYTIDPGDHHTTAEGLVNGLPVAFDQDHTIKEGERLKVEIVLKPANPKYLTAGQISCMVGAKSQEDLLRCLPAKEKPLVATVGLVTGAYTDTTAVQVLSPSIYGGVASPTKGWNVNGSYLLDVVSAASPDLVSSASRPFKDMRHAGAVSGGYKPGNFGANGAVSLSVESDYVSRSGHVGVVGDFRDKTVTPNLGVAYTVDTIGRAGTPYSVFSRDFTTAAVDAGSTFIMSKNEVLSIGAVAMFERGDQSKPYRLIPTFAPGAYVGVGASAAEVNSGRLAVRPYEQLPLERDRYALAGRYARRSGVSTFRIEERLYYDTWGTVASTTDARYIRDITSRFGAGPHARLHAQGAASFYERIYYTDQLPDGALSVPRFRSTDREMSPLVSVTGGVWGRLDLLAPGRETQVSLIGQFDVLYTRFFNSLYIKNRLALYGTLGLEVRFE
jgi:hypothetical protein